MLTCLVLRNSEEYTPRAPTPGVSGLCECRPIASVSGSWLRQLILEPELNGANHSPG